MAAPDVIFEIEDENFHPLVVIAESEADAKRPKSSLCDWNSKDPSRLLLLIHELRDLYTLYQRKRIGELDDERIKFEVSTIFSREGIEVCMISGPEKVVFPVSRKYSSASSAPRIKLVSSSELKMLFSVEDVKLPPWLDGMCMAEYLPTVEENLKAKILEAVASVGARRRFIEALAPLFGRPVEADPVFCRKATILAASGIFTFLVFYLFLAHFSLSTQFPRQQPVLVLQSSQHFNSQGMPIMSPPLADYPWSPRWDASQMAERIFEFLAEECLNFKQYCNDTLRQQH